MLQNRSPRKPQVISEVPLCRRYGYGKVSFAILLHEQETTKPLASIVGCYLDSEHCFFIKTTFWIRCLPASIVSLCTGVGFGIKTGFYCLVLPADPWLNTVGCVYTKSRPLTQHNGELGRGTKPSASDAWLKTAGSWGRQTDRCGTNNQQQNKNKNRKRLQHKRMPYCGNYWWKTASSSLWSNGVGFKGAVGEI